MTQPIAIANLFSISTLGTAGGALVAFIPNIIGAVVVLIVALFLYRLTRTPLGRILALRDFDHALIDLLVHNLYKYTIGIVAIIIALGQLGIDVTAAIAGVGVVGIAVGFAAKDTIANIFSGISIFWDKPFVVGDLIEIGSHMGVVREITLRSTRIRTGQNQYVVLPNQIIANETVTNHSKHGPVRVDIPIGIGYGEDVEHARRVLLAMLEGDQHVLRDGDHPEVGDPDVVVADLADSSVVVKLRFWVPDALDQFGVRYTYTEQAKRVLTEAGIEIPFPQRVIHHAPKAHGNN